MASASEEKIERLQLEIEKVEKKKEIVAMILETESKVALIDQKTQQRDFLRQKTDFIQDQISNFPKKDHSKTLNLIVASLCDQAEN